MAIVAHADDAELTIAGTLALLARAGWSVSVVTLTVPTFGDQPRDERMHAAERAADIIGYNVVWPHNGPRHMVEDWSSHHLVAEVDAHVLAALPDVVFSHWQGDSHEDHRRVARAVLSASRRGAFDLYAISPSEHRTPAFDAFPANVLVDISDAEELKRDAIRQYDYPAGPLGGFGLDALYKRWRGQGASIGMAASERLLLLRQFGIPTGLAGQMPDRWHERSEASNGRVAVRPS